MAVKAFSSLMEIMKSESKNPALEAAQTMKSTMVADLEASIHEFEGTASLLENQFNEQWDDAYAGHSLPRRPSSRSQIRRQPRRNRPRAKVMILRTGT